MSVSETNFYQVIVFLDINDEVSWEDLEHVAFESFECDGVSDFSLNEEQVDEILGKDAFCGGDLPEELADRLEKEVAGRAGKTFIFYEGEASQRSLDFQAYLESHSMKFEAKTQVTQDWDAEWRKHYAPIEVTDKLRVVPAWMKKEERTQKTEIYIDPGRGFGTGEHETTFLCLKHLSELCESGIQFKDCLDFGCGSGILGIAHLLLKGSMCDFVDIDKNALDNCLRNIQLNLEGRELVGSSLILRDRYDSSRKYDLVFANILEHVLISEKETILDSLADGATLIVSGLLKEQGPSILEHYKMLTHEKTHAKGDWLAIQFKRQ